MRVIAMWACPHCRLALQPGPDGRSLVCTSRHTFDRAREGYVNLLPSNRKRSRDPGDSAPMLAARRRVHEAATYQPLADALVAALAGLGTPGSVLDLGCGEGYYCGALAGALPAAAVYGIDISRAALRLAARAHPEASFAVASAYDLPLLNESLGLVVRIFAPSDDNELVRVLKPGGYYLEVTPAPRHLWQLRAGLYDTPREHTPARVAIAGMQLAARFEVEYEITPPPALLADIVSMTPFAHRGHREKRNTLLLRPAAAPLAMGFSVRIFRRPS